ncbi:MAG TPA: hypothetical protein DEF42_00115, partial [Desulfosporosinus sp.]|nr:hypothetical protein [Desulfosporosinus sp.]
MLFLIATPVLAADTTFMEDNNSSIVYSTGWSRPWSTNATANYYYHSNTAEALASLSFNGTGIKWIGATGSGSGIAEILIDGKSEAMIDLYSPTTSYQQVIFRKTHLDRGNHTLQIRVTGNKNPQASGAYVNIDGFEIIDSDDKIPPSAPSTPFVFNGNERVELKWQVSSDSDLEGYNVYRSTVSNSGFVRVNPWLIKEGTSFINTSLTNGTTYYYHITAVDVVGNESQASPVVSALPAVYVGSYDDNGTGIKYTGTWDNRVYSGSATGNYYMRSGTAEAKVDIAFYGTGIRWISPRSSTGGIAEVTLDGNKELVDLYQSGTTQWQQTVYEETGLTEGLHQLSIRVTGTKDELSSNTYVFMDSIEVIGAVLEHSRVEEDSITMDYRGIWDYKTSTSYSGGKIIETSKGGAAVEYTFYGTGLEWLAHVDSGKGIAKVSIDGEAPVLVDLYRPSSRAQEIVYKRYGLSLGQHKLRIEASGNKSPSSSNYYVNI